MFKNVDLPDSSRMELGSNLTLRLYDITSVVYCLLLSFKLSLCLHVVVSFLSVKSDIFLLVLVSVIIVIYFGCWMVEL